MGTLGNISGIKDFEALKAIQELDRRFKSLEGQLSRLRQNSSTILTELSNINMPSTGTTDVPPHVVNTGSVYTKVVNGITELFYKDSNGSTLGREIQLTNNGSILGIGPGTTNAIAKFTASNVVDDSNMTDDGTTIQSSIFHTLRPSATVPSEAMALTEDAPSGGAFTARQSHWIRWMAPFWDGSAQQATHWRMTAVASDDLGNSTFSLWNDANIALGTYPNPGTWAGVFVINNQGAISTAHRFTGSIEIDKCSSINGQAVDAISLYGKDNGGGYAGGFQRTNAASGDIFRWYNQVPTNVASISNTGVVLSKESYGTGTLKSVCVRSGTADSGITLGSTTDTGQPGRLDSYTADGLGAIAFLIKPSNAMSGTASILQIQDYSGANCLQIQADKSICLVSTGTAGGLFNVGGTLTGAMYNGLNFISTFNTTGGNTAAGVSGTFVCGILTSPVLSSTGAAASIVGRYSQIFGGATASRNTTDIWGSVVNQTYPLAATYTHTTVGGWKVLGYDCGAMGTPATNAYGGYVSAHSRGTNRYGIYIENQTGGTINNGIFLATATAPSTNKSLAFRDQNAWISSNDASHLDLHAATSVDVNANMDISAYNIITDTSTGTKIGTATNQKLGFFNATPVIQPAAANQAAITNSSGGSRDGTLAQVMSGMGEIYHAGNSTATVITTTATYTKVAPTTTTLGMSDLFDMPSNGRLRYTGANTRNFHLGCTISVKGVGANDTVKALLYKNGGVNANNEFTSGTALTGGTIQTKLGAIGDVFSTAIHVMVSLAQNDYIELGIQNTTDDDDLTVTDMNIFGVSMPDETVNNNDTDIHTLLDEIRTALVNTGIIKGSA